MLIDNDEAAKAAARRRMEKYIRDNDLSPRDCELGNVFNQSYHKETRANCAYAATFWDIYSISPPIYIYIYIHIYTFFFI